MAELRILASVSAARGRPSAAPPLRAHEPFVCPLVQAAADAAARSPVKRLGKRKAAADVSVPLGRRLDNAVGV